MRRGTTVVRSRPRPQRSPVSASARRVTRRGRTERERRRAQITGLVGFALAASLPWVLWHRVIGDIASQFRLDLRYLLAECSPWFLIALGTLFFVPVVLSVGRNPEGRFYPRARGAYAGWGASLYILGVALASQVAQLASLTQP